LIVVASWLLKETTPSFYKKWGVQINPARIGGTCSLAIIVELIIPVEESSLTIIPGSKSVSFGWANT